MFYRSNRNNLRDRSAKDICAIAGRTPGVYISMCEPITREMNYTLTRSVKPAHFGLFRVSSCRLNVQQISLVTMNLRKCEVILKNHLQATDFTIFGAIRCLGDCYPAWLWAGCARSYSEDHSCQTCLQDFDPAVVGVAEGAIKVRS